MLSFGQFYYPVEILRVHDCIIYQIDFYPLEKKYPSFILSFCFQILRAGKELNWRSEIVHLVRDVCSMVGF